MSAIIVVTIPEKTNDPTSYTAKWGEEAIKMMRNYGYTVIDLKKNEVTYENVSKSIAYYKPRLYVHLGHGCPSSLQGQNECIITRRFELDELLSMPNFREIVMPLIYESGCGDSCLKSIPSDICNPVCMNDTNINLLKDTIVYTVACYSALQLGKCAVKYGAETYCGYQDLMLFPVDEMKSQDLFKNVHLTFLKELLEGKSIAESEQRMNDYEDSLIRFYKKTKYISLPLLWNKLNRKILGNKNARIYQ